MAIAVLIAIILYFSSSTEWRGRYAVSEPIRDCVGKRMATFREDNPGEYPDPQTLSTMEAACAVEDFKNRSN